MKIRQFLREQKEKHAVLAFGRMNPPTTGHKKLVDKVREVASQHNASHHIVLSHSQDPKKNPLTSAQKIKHAKRFFPGANVTTSSKEEPSILHHAARMHREGNTHLHVVGGSDRVNEYHKLLHKYNGVRGSHGYFDFRKITVHSAGERDSKAEGTAGMSGSKMRQHAAEGNYSEFKKGVPSHVSERHAKELYHDVRKGMKIDEQIHEFYTKLVEGVYDHGIFHAVFLAGGPGSGKDTTLKKVLGGHGLTEINSDQAFEHLMHKEGLSKLMPKSEEEKRDTLRRRAKNIKDLKHHLAFMGRNGVIINGTGHDTKAIKQMKDKLEAMGYQTSMLMVNTDNETSKRRNIERGTQGGRSVPEEIRQQRWNAVQSARTHYAKMFGDRYLEYDNSHDNRTASSEIVQAKEKELQQLHKHFGKTISKLPNNDTAKKWISDELTKKDVLPIEKEGHSRIPHPSFKTRNATHNRAIQMGLTYYGHGRYGKKGSITHRSVGGKLMDMSKFQDKQNLNEAASITITGDTPEEINSVISMLHSNTNNDDQYGLSDTDAYRGLTLGKKIRTVGNKVNEYVFNNTSITYKDSKHVQIPNESDNWQEGSSRTFAKTGIGLISESRESKKTCDNITENKKITIEQIRSKIKKESIDKGTEAVAGGGPINSYSVEKNRKKDGKVSMTELTGDETTYSIGDQKEDELKKQGLSLKSFKGKIIAKKFIG